jgi:uncharacterized protein (DUF885 family)
MSRFQNHPLAPRRLVAVVALSFAALTAAAQPTTIGDFFDRFTADWVRGNPDQAIGTRYFNGEEQRALERQLTPLTAEWAQGRRDLARRGLAELARFDVSRVNKTDRLSAELLRWQLQVIVDGEPFADYAFPFEQFQGVNVNLVSAFTVVQSLQTEADGENYLARLQQMPVRLNEAIAEAQRIAAKGLIPPRFILNLTIKQMKQFVDQPPARNPLVTTIADKLALMSLPQARRDELRARAERTVADQIYPAWQRAIAFLETLVPKVNDDAGLWRLSGGAEAYAYNLRRYTSTDLTADQIHDIGLQQVARIETEMDRLLRQIGRTQGSVKDRIEQLKKDQAYPLTEAGRVAIMAEIDRILRDAERRAGALFDHRPTAAVRAQPFPRFREDNAAGSYTSPSPDGSRPGIFQIPLRPSNMTRFGLRTLVYHETVPGHHFQIALEMENTDEPRFRRIRAFGGIPALSEGWGLYAERTAAEAGWYEGDIEGRLGQLDAELFRARRLVVDTGIHAKHWTREQAIDYGIEPSEIERYVVYPGQACAYMLGELKLIELRDRARARLGDRFSFKDYHNAVLGLGTLPLPMLEREVNAYIEDRAK